MTDTHDTGRPISRRAVLAGGSALAGGLLIAGTPDLALAGSTGTSGSRPIITHGVQTGDVQRRDAQLWSRADRPSRMLVEVADNDRFRKARRLRGPIAGPGNDYTAQLRIPKQLLNSAKGGRLHYRVRFRDLDSHKDSEPVVGSLPVVGKRTQDIRFAWVGDCAGQGWGINPDFGGMRAWETMRTFDPEFLIFSGDTVYADGPLQETVELRDGTTWRNIVIPEKAKVAETLDEFRGQWKYNLLDENVKRFNAEVPVIAQWDDHEVVNNWYPGEILEDPRYTVTDVDLLARRAAKAFGEYMPIGATEENQGRVYRKIDRGALLDVFVIDMRTFRAANSPNLQTGGPEAVFLGREQIDWLLKALERSKAAWKVIASDMPIGLLVPDGSNWEAVANGDDGEPLGRELEIAYLLGEMKRRNIKDVVWLTADVHYAAAHHYHPDRAQFKGFDPFWEFVSGPINAGTFGPNGLDGTFGPEVVYQLAAEYPNQPPSDGRQFFGVVDIDAHTRSLTARLVDIHGTVLFSQELTNSQPG